MKPIKVAFQGETGAFSEEAVQALFPDAEAVPLPSFEAVFEAAMGGSVARAVVPIENSLFGSVHLNYDLLRRHELVIIGELKLRIRHHLMAPPGATLSDVRHVYSHPQALGQCQVFLRERLPHAEAVPAYDTAGAAKMVAEGGRPGAAAIASERAAAEYGLHVLAAGIESNRQNYTRFLALARPEEGRLSASDADPDSLPSSRRRDGVRPFKTSLVYAMRQNVPGALFKSLAVFALREIDLVKIESRPLVGRPGQYLFYLDVEGSTNEEPVQRALSHLGEITAFLKVLGSYPQGEVVE